MAQLVAIYNAPVDPTAFQKHYEEVHGPLAKKIPGLRSLVTSVGQVNALVGNAPHLLAILTFDSMADLQAGMATPEGVATAADLQNFASGGATLLVYDSKEI